jgi:ABC-type uncharacterized transport system ATPase subunit
MDFVRSIARTVTVLHEGHVLAEGTIDEVQATPQVKEVYLGEWWHLMLTVNPLNQFYGGSHTLRNLSLEVPKGSCTCLMGRNGMGKTTLLKCIVGLIPVSSGRLLLSRRTWRDSPPRHGHTWASATYPKVARSFRS